MLKGLLLKDFLVFSKQMKIFLLMLIAFAVVPSTFFQGFALMYCAMLPVTAVAYDEQSKWERFAEMMPYSVKNLVLSKYILGFSACGVIAALEIVSSEVMSFLQVKVGNSEPPSPGMIFIMFCLGVILMGVNLPLLFRLGVEKGRFVYILLTIGIAMIVVYSVTDYGFLWGLNPAVYPAAAFALAVVVTVISVNISAKVYKKKNH